ncbi:hypothetical protein BH18ACT4_BH18ACT4_00340 [soil metagenome]
MSVSLARLAAALVSVGHLDAGALAVGGTDARPSPYLADPVDRRMLDEVVRALSDALGEQSFRNLRSAGAEFGDDEIAARMRATVSDVLSQKVAPTATG